MKKYNEYLDSNDSYLSSQGYLDRTSNGARRVGLTSGSSGFKLNPMVGTTPENQSKFPTTSNQLTMNNGMTLYQSGTPDNQTSIISNEMASTWAKQLMDSRLILNDGHRCLVFKQRRLPLNITSGQPISHSPLASGCFFSFNNYDPNNQGNTINLGQVVLLEEEVDGFKKALDDNLLSFVSLENNYWELPLCCIHFKGVMPPFYFADAVFNVWSTALIKNLT